MSLSETYHLACSAHSRLTRELARPNRNLRRMVGHRAHYEALRTRIADIESAPRAVSFSSDNAAPHRVAKSSPRSPSPPPPSSQQTTYEDEDCDDDDDDYFYDDDADADSELSLTRCPSRSISPPPPELESDDSDDSDSSDGESDSDADEHVLTLTTRLYDLEVPRSRKVGGALSMSTPAVQVA